MKRLTTIIAILFSVTAFGQQPNTSPADTTALISKAQIESVRQAVLKRLEPMEGTLIAAKYNGLSEGINVIVEELLNLWNREYLKRKKPAK